jgi:hypothetical protein
MAGSRRTPIDRTPRPVLDAECVRLFKRGSELIDEGCEEDKEELRRIRLALHRRLGLKPWHESVFDVDDAAPDDPVRFREWKWVRSLRDQLAELAQPRRAREGEESEADDAGAEPLR